MDAERDAAAAGRSMAGTSVSAEAAEARAGNLATGAPWRA